ncbi:hypothetical protein A0H81_10909 [Grifola frondosa]|uniref:Uncharacterized protein n=1 Tax=Grifola frondosa TaxID=5627 RepID=A0A1C7LYD1_GRIFR|nr:hypothetical protein A0H81_10909 [Grifola frondosa]
MASAASGSSAAPAAGSSNPPILATGDWTKNLVHLAKTAELKKHALTLQLHTAHILSAHASLEQKNKAIQDLKEQKNKLESERSRLLNCLREADLLEATLNKESAELRQKIQVITDGDYAIAKQDVDKLRQELGQPPLPSLQSTLEEKSAESASPFSVGIRSGLPELCRYLKALRLQAESASASVGNKRNAEEYGPDGQPTNKRPRGRPKGSKNAKSKGKTPAPSDGTAGS